MQSLLSAISFCCSIHSGNLPMLRRKRCEPRIPAGRHQLRGESTSQDRMRGTGRKGRTKEISKHNCIVRFEVPAEQRRDSWLSVQTDDGDNVYRGH